MSYNELLYDSTNALIKNQRNCATLDNKKAFNLHYKAQAFDDPCFVDVQTRQSVGVGNYGVTNLYDCNTLIPETIDKATNLPMVFFKNGYDVGQGVVDESSKLRVGLTKQYPKCPQQLFTRPYATVPYAGRGSGNVNIETQLLPGEDTSSKRSCNSLSGVFIPQQYTPLIDHLQYNIQNEQHIVEQAVDPAWIRGGANSRLITRDISYLEQCGYSYMNKTMNENFWSDKFKYL
jgi:hypothetical protein